MVYFLETVSREEEEEEEEEEFSVLVLEAPWVLEELRHQDPMASKV